MVCVASKARVVGVVRDRQGDGVQVIPFIRPIVTVHQPEASLAGRMDKISRADSFVILDNVSSRRTTFRTGIGLSRGTVYDTLQYL